MPSQKRGIHIFNRRRENSSISMENTEILLNINKPIVVY
jgi:hypothetical protein